MHIGDQIVGFLGELHPQWLEKYDIPLPPVLFELDLATLERACPPAFKEVSHQPTATRDVAVLVDLQVAVDTFSKA